MIMAMQPIEPDQKLALELDNRPPTVSYYVMIALHLVYGKSQCATSGI